MDGQGDRHTATRYYQQAVAIFRETGDQWALTHPLSDLAWRTWDAGHLHQALTLMHEYLAIFRQLRDQGSVPYTLGNIAFMSATVGDFAGATQAAQEKSEIELARGLQGDRAYGLHALAHLNVVQGHLDLARQQLESALKVARAADNHGFTADVLALLGRIAIYTDAADEAAARFHESQRWAAAAEPARWREAAILFGLGQIACLRSDYKGADALYRESLSRVSEIWPEIPSRLEGLAQAAVGQGQPQRAATLLGAANNLRAIMRAPVLPVDRPGYERLLATVRAALSNADFRQAWALGEAMSADESVAYALN